MPGKLRKAAAVLRVLQLCSQGAVLGSTVARAQGGARGNRRARAPHALPATLLLPLAHTPAPTVALSPASLHPTPLQRHSLPRNPRRHCDAHLPLAATPGLVPQLMPHCRIRLSRRGAAVTMAMGVAVGVAVAVAVGVAGGASGAILGVGWPLRDGAQLGRRAEDHGVGQRPQRRVVAHASVPRGVQWVGAAWREGSGAACVAGARRPGGRSGGRPCSLPDECGVDEALLHLLERRDAPARESTTGGMLGMHGMAQVTCVGQLLSLPLLQPRTCAWTRASPMPAAPRRGSSWHGARRRGWTRT